jgi:hypothetical protein
MTDKKVSDLVALAGADLDPAADLFMVVDDSASTSKSITKTALLDTISVASGELTLKSNVIGGEAITVANEAVGVLTPTRYGGFLLFTTGGAGLSPQGPRTAMFYYDVGTSVAMVKVTITGLSANIVSTTGTLTGTTGTATNVTLSPQDDGTIQVENQSGGTISFQATYL